MRGAADLSGNDGQAAHQRGANGSWRRPARKRIDADETEGRPHRMTAKKRPESALDDASENRDLEPAEDEQVDQAGCDQCLLELGRDSVADAKDHAQENGGVWSRQGSIECRRVSLAH